VRDKKRKRQNKKKERRVVDLFFVIYSICLMNWKEGLTY
jgi:hypothetical protein